MSAGRVGSPRTWLRLGAAAMLAVALWNPDLPVGSVPLHLVVLIDDSASMPRARVDAAWRALARALADLPAESRLSLIRFGAEPRLELEARPLTEPETIDLLASPAPPRHLAVADYRTDIGAALGLGLDLTQARAGMRTLLLLVSDGTATLGNVEPALGIAALRNLPVLWWSPEAAATDADAWIDVLRAPQRVLAGESFPLTLTLGANRPLQAEVQVLADGRPLVRRSLELNGTGHRTFALSLTLEEARVYRLTAILTAPGDAVPENDEHSLLVAAGGRPGVLMIAPRPVPSPVARSLADGGWALTLAHPGGFDPTLLEGNQVVVLEQMGISSLTLPHWRAIDRAVRREGLGLVLLGGPGTFGAGGYRHSLLEGLLPLIAEAPPRLAPAAVLFAVDKSGSMARQTGVGATRLQLARQAVAGSVRSLAPEDLAGLLMFDREVTESLPLGRHRDPKTALAAAAAWQATPGGGTRLVPVLERALTALAAAPVEQRLLALVSDGRFADAVEAAKLGPRLEDADIDVIALAIGQEADTSTLEPLIGRGGGRLLRVADVAELPVLMQTEIGALRSAVESDPVTPDPVGPLPFPVPEPGAWPVVRAYPVTRLRQGADVYLAAPRGDPLLAAHFAGNGRVVALAAGLGPWAPAWASWGRWGPFLGGLVQWVASDSVRDLEIGATGAAGSLKLRIDARGERDWTQTESLGVQVRDPAGRWHSFAAEPAAPGRYELAVPATRIGRYDIRAGAGSRTATLALWHHPMDEFLHRAPEGLAAAVAQGLVHLWSPGSPALRASSPGAPSRTLFAALALGIYLLALLVELAPWYAWIGIAGLRIGKSSIGGGLRENR